MVYREIDPDDFAAFGAVRRGQQPQHCGRPAEYQDSGIWECTARGCNAYAMSNRPGGPVQWTESR